MWAQNKDFGFLSQMGLTKRLVPSLVRATLVELLYSGMSLMVRVLIQKPDTSISFYFRFSVISQFGQLSRGLSKVFYFILFYFGPH